MVTLTYPATWEDVASSGDVVKKHLAAFFKRYARAWEHEWIGVWKLEFQRRGAPHFHLLMSPPHGVAGGATRRRGRKMVGAGLPFRKWLSIVWADIVGASGHERFQHELAGTGVDYAEGAKARDPRAAAVYFAKHGVYSDKDYQSEVPDLWAASGKSVGRFWGYRGLSPLTRGITITAEESIRMARVLRALGGRTTRWNAATRSRETVKAMRKVRRPRRRILPGGEVKPARDKDTGELVTNENGTPVDHIQYRWTLVPVRRFMGTNLGGGYLCVKSGETIARDLGRYRETCLSDRNEPAPVGMRGSIQDRVTAGSGTLLGD
ncbi:rolling circle replication-associated protein [Corynebacterium mastitidis]